MNASTINHVSQLRRRVRVARGRDAGDLLLRGGRIVNVFTESLDDGNVVIADGVIAGIGRYDWSAAETVDLDGDLILPGLIDAHIHVESTLLMPCELSRVVIPRGTTTIIADPHEIANVSGIEGIELMLADSEGLPLEVFFMVPSCVPASRFESAGATLDADSVTELLRHPRVIGLAEMMNYPGVLTGDEQVHGKIAAALAGASPIDGHAPGVTGQSLVAYAACGIRSDHESTSPEEAGEKARLGMLVQVREGTAARNLDALLPSILGNRLGEWCLCTDDITVNELMEHGHINALLRRVVQAGVPLARAVRHACLVPARHYGLTDRGAVAPGYRADLIVVPGPDAFDPRVVVKSGRIVAQDGAYLAEMPSSARGIENTIHIGRLEEEMFNLRPAGDTCPVIEVVSDQILTKRAERRVRIDPSSTCWAFGADQDVALIACIERHRASGRVGVGLVSGFGFRHRGALGSSVAHDAHNLVVTGTDPCQMLACAKSLQEIGGGWVVVRDGRVAARLALPVAGLMSGDCYESVAQRHDAVNEAARSLGCPLSEPFGTLSFMCLSVIPELRITDRGLLDVNRQELVGG